MNTAPKDRWLMLKYDEGWFEGIWCHKLQAWTSCGKVVEPSDWAAITGY